VSSVSNRRPAYGGGVVCGIQARTSSSRLPGKVLLDVGGRPLIDRVVERARAAALVDEVFVLTSTDPSDDALAAHCVAQGVPVRRGPLEDVLARYLALVEETRPDHVVRVTGDCPLLEPDFVDLQLGALSAFDADFVRTVPAGAETSAGIAGTLAGAGAFSARALLAAAGSDDPRDREHVASFFFKRHAARFRHVEVEVDADYQRAGLRLCVDEPEDLEFVRAVYAHFGERRFSALEAIRWLDDQPAIRAIHDAVEESRDNRDCRRLAREARTPVVGRWP